MPETFTACVNEIAWNELDQFIFTERRGNTIGDIDITGVDRNDADSIKNQPPQDLPQ